MINQNNPSLNLNKLFSGHPVESHWITAPCEWCEVCSSTAAVTAAFAPLTASASLGDCELLLACRDSTKVLCKNNPGCQWSMWKDCSNYMSVWLDNKTSCKYT